MKLEAGKRYLTRDGGVTKRLEAVVNPARFSEFSGKVEESGLWSWRSDGQFCAAPNHPNDLVAEYHEPEVKPEPDIYDAVAEIREKSTGALSTQVAGSHYKNLPIQPVEFCQKNELNYCESAVVKYVCRHRSKNGRQDIEKAIHFLQLLIQLEYPDNPGQSTPDQP